MIAFFTFALVAAITPGPSNLILLSVGANRGLVRGLPTLLGVVSGMGLMMFLAAFGLGALLLNHPTLLQVLKGAGVGFLLWLAWKIASAGRAEAAVERKILGFWGAAAFQWINPKSWLVSVSAVGVYLDPQSGGVGVQSLYFGALFALAALPSCSVWLAFGAALQRLLASDRAARVFNAAMGILLAGSIVLFIS